MLGERVLAGGAALSIATACSPQTRDPAEIAVERSSGTWRVAARDATSNCIDVGELRVCWSDARGAVPASVVSRSLPALEPVSRLGWRCTGSGSERTCRDRTAQVGSFGCAGAHCVEQHPRFPDDGEWTCADAGGSVVCTGGDRAAGVTPSESDSGFRCGLRRGTRARPGERVCVDFAPDFPDGSASGWRCRYEHAGAPRKICDRSSREHVLGDGCSPGAPCVDGSVCAGGRCLPLTPSPECWLDSDCDSGACRFGSCLAPDAPRVAPAVAPKPAGPRAPCSVVLRAVDPEIDLERVRAQPANAVRRATSVPGALVVEIDPRALANDLELDVGGACPVRISRSELERTPRLERDLAPRVTVDAPDGPVGPDRAFTIRLTPRCADVEDITWTRIGGTLRAAVTDEQKLHFSARTPTLETLIGTPPWGIVPVSAAAQGRSVVEVSWSDGERRERRRVNITALARDRGLPSVAIDVPFVLGGSGWHFTESPRDTTPIVMPAEHAAIVRLPQSGRYVLADAANRRVRVSAFAYDETPLDCGRGDCHAAETAAASATRMTPVLASGLNGAFDRYDAACAIACHATGEPGLHDGGFSDVASELGFEFDPRHSSDWDSLPRDLRRLGGVGCLACHGPGAIPEPDARWAILRTGVCATCHDAPPRYGHVAAWRSTRMAQADSDARTRAEPCARCHTTSGALAARRGHRAGTAPPTDVGAVGLGCVVCHAVHGDPPRNRPTSPERVLHAPALLRDALPPVELGDVENGGAARSAVCMSCHFPADPRTPWASAAALWAGRGGLDPESDRALDGPAPHRDLQGGCLACHGGGPAGLERGSGHGFRADRTECSLCHTELPARPDLMGRARSLLGLLHERGAVTDVAWVTPHALGRALKTTTPLGRAAYDVLLVIEDPAAADHNPTYASALLDAAERALSSR